MEQQRPMIIRWEYLVMEATINYGGSKFQINGEVNNQLKNQPLHVVLNQLGASGWDMTAQQVINPNVTIYTFKRPMRTPTANLAQQQTDKSGQ